MLRIDRSVINRIVAAKDAVDLHEHLQAAIQLEHSTVPVYLTALYSIKKGTNPEAAETLRSVVIDEMLHMAIAANTLTAIGGSPAFDAPGFVPTYPGPLPMNIGEGLIVGLEKLTRERVGSVFMRIEEPETPLEFPVKTLRAAPEPEYATIGEFYRAIIEKIEDLGDRIFKGRPERQVANPRWFSGTELFPIHNARQAVRALTHVVREGEGTTKSPLDPEGGFAHYYRFAELFHGRRLVRDDSVKQGYSYSGAPVPLVPEGIWNLTPNLKAEQLKPATRARLYADQFNLAYTRLLAALQETFNGRPGALDHAMGLMYELRLAADTLVSLTLPETGLQAAPPFQYIPTG